MADAQRKRELIAELDRARSRATAHQRGFAQDLQVGDKLKVNVNEHRGIWLGAATVLGLLISKIPPRTKTIKIAPSGRGRVDREVNTAGKIGLLFAAMKWAFDLVRPLLITWGRKRMSELMANRPAGGYRRN